MAQQTAVSWLQDKLNNVKPTQFCSIETIKEWVEQAKQMEKEQIIAAFDIACEDDDRIGREYYNETFTSIPQDETPFAIETEQS
jgi:hypothetical protein